MTESDIKENRDKLIKALESGKYKKGKNLLRSENNEFCCLGVACEVVGIKPEIYSVEFGDDRYMYKDKWAYAPQEVVKAFGFYSDVGTDIDNDYMNNSLTNINDNSDTFEPVIKALKSGRYWEPL